MPRIARVVLPGYPHHIIQRGNNRQRVFFDTQDRQKYLNLLTFFSKDIHCKIYAYCLMLNHIHLLFEPEKINSLAKVMQKLALCYTQYFNKKYDRTGRLWECRYHSSLVDKDNYMWAVIRYIETNPLRAGISKHPEEYIWSSAESRLLSKSNSYVKLQKYFDKNELESYRKYFYEIRPNMEAFITKQTYDGRPIGNNQFLNRIEKLVGKVLIPRPKGRMKGYSKKKK